METTVTMRGDGDGKPTSSKKDFSDSGFQSPSDQSYLDEFSDVQNLITDILNNLSGEGCGAGKMKMDARSSKQSIESMDVGAVSDQSTAVVLISDQSPSSSALDESDVSTHEYRAEKVATEDGHFIENSKNSLTETLLMAKIRNSLFEVMKWLQLGAAHITRYRLALLRKTVAEQRSLMECLLHKDYYLPQQSPDRLDGRLSARDREVNQLAEFLESVDKSLKKIKNRDCVRMDERYVLNGNHLQKQSFHLRGVNMPVPVPMPSSQLGRPAGGAPEVSPDPPPIDHQPLINEDASIPDQAEDVENRSPVRRIPIMANDQPLASTSTPVGSEQQRQITVLQFPPRSAQGPRRFNLPDYRILRVKKNEIFYPGSAASNLWQALENRPSAVPRAILENIDHW